MEQTKKELKYNSPIIVTRAQYRRVIKKFSEVVTYGRDYETGKYYIKLWDIKFKDAVEECLYGVRDKYKIKIEKKIK